MLLKPNHSRFLLGALALFLLLAATLLLSAPTWRESALSSWNLLRSRPWRAGTVFSEASSGDPQQASDLNDREQQHRQSVMDLRDAVMGWNARQEFRDGRYELGSLDLDTYAAEMRHIYQSLMVSEWDRAVSNNPPLHPLLETVLARLSVSSRPVDTPPLPKIVWTSSPAQQVEINQFDPWRTMNPEFDVLKLDDGMVTSWVKETFGDAKIVAEFAALPKMILKIDTFRYLAVLVEGGVWGDSDTTSVKPIMSWGAGSTDETDPRLLSQAARRAALWSSFDSSSPPSSSASYDALTASPPALTISPELFSLESQHKQPAPWWVKSSFARRVQIVQWSFAGTSGHPVLLDAVGRIFARGRGIREGVREEEAAGVLDWTGPGLFTDCVFRYLKARWGFDFDSLEGFDHPIRIGDVLILPRNAFQAATSGESEKELDDNSPHHVVWHKFAGSWKGDQ